MEQGDNGFEKAAKEMQKLLSEIPPEQIAAWKNIQENMLFTDEMSDTIARVIEYSKPSDAVMKALEMANTVPARIAEYINSINLPKAYIAEALSSIISLPDNFSNTHLFYNDVMEKTKLLSESYRALEKISVDFDISKKIIDNRVFKPTIEVASHYKIVNELGIAKINDEKLEEKNKNIVLTESRSSLLELSSISSELKILIDGAEQAMKSSNPDKVRHTITSLRELVTQIIHTLAPDELVKAKIKEKNYYKDGKPTRKARLSYILNSIDGNDLLVEFYYHDIEAVISLFDLFQRGTHQVKSSISDKQLESIFYRVINLANYLVESKK